MKEGWFGIGAAAYLRRELSFLITLTTGTTLSGIAHEPPKASAYAATIAVMAALSMAAGWREAALLRQAGDAMSPSPLAGGLRSLLVSLTSSTIAMLLSIGLAVAAGQTGLTALAAPFAIILAIGGSAYIAMEDSARQRARDNAAPRKEGAN